MLRNFVSLLLLVSRCGAQETDEVEVDPLANLTINCTGGTELNETNFEPVTRRGRYGEYLIGFFDETECDAECLALKATLDELAITLAYELARALVFNENATANSSVGVFEINNASQPSAVRFKLNGSLPTVLLLSHGAMWPADMSNLTHAALYDMVMTPYDDRGKPKLIPPVRGMLSPMHDKLEAIFETIDYRILSYGLCFFSFALVIVGAFLPKPEEPEEETKESEKKKDKKDKKKD